MVVAAPRELAPEVRQISEMLLHLVVVLVPELVQQVRLEISMVAGLVRHNWRWLEVQVPVVLPVVDVPDLALQVDLEIRSAAG